MNFHIPWGSMSKSNVEKKENPSFLPGDLREYGEDECEWKLGIWENKRVWVKLGLGKSVIGLN